MTELGDYRRLVEKPMIEAYDATVSGLRAEIERLQQQLADERAAHQVACRMRDEAEAEATRLRAWLECIERTTDEEIKARFPPHHSKTEEQMAGKSVIYTMLSVPRNMARKALAGDGHEQAAAPKSPALDQGGISDRLANFDAYGNRIRDSR